MSLPSVPFSRLNAFVSDRDPDHRCGTCIHAHWPDQAPGYYADIRGRCDHPRTRLMPCPEPQVVRLSSGRVCRFYAAGGDEPKRRME